MEGSTTIESFVFLTNCRLYGWLACFKIQEIVFASLDIAFVCAEQNKSPLRTLRELIYGKFINETEHRREV